MEFALMCLIGAALIRNVYEKNCSVCDTKTWDITSCCDEPICKGCAKEAVQTKGWISKTTVFVCPLCQEESEIPSE
jgi:hypothetical protein